MSRLNHIGTVAATLAVGLLAGACNPAVFGRCVAYNNYAEGTGFAFPKDRPDEQTEVMYRHTVTSASGVNESFVSFEPGEVDFMEFCVSPGYVQNVAELNFRLDARLDLGVPQSPGQQLQTPRCFQSFADDGSGMAPFFGGGLDAPTGRVEFTSLEATFIDRSPPTLDIRLEGPDPQGTIWVFELRVVSGTAGNAMVCS